MRLLGAVLISIVAGLALLAVVKFSPLFLNSRIDRVHEKNLPLIRIERGGVVYCRMKADDFRFPLPRGSRGTNAVVTGGFDTVDGTVEAHFDGTNTITAGEYQEWLAGKVPVGGRVSVKAVAGGLLISFHYFGDR